MLFKVGLIALLGLTAACSTTPNMAKVEKKPVLSRQALREVKQITQLQKRLMQKGFEPGPIDGLVGPKLTAAVKRFQYVAGLKVNGEIDQYLRQSVYYYNGPSELTKKSDHADAFSAEYWAFAIRPNAIGHGTATAHTEAQAEARALDACNRKKAKSIRFGRNTQYCIPVAIFSMETERCATVVHGYMRFMSLTSHFGKSFAGEPKPRNKAQERAFASCRSKWGPSHSATCRNRNGNVGNAIQTSFTYCTSDFK